VTRAVFDCHGVSVAKVSTNQRFIAYATLQGSDHFSVICCYMWSHSRPGLRGT